MRFLGFSLCALLLCASAYLPSAAARGPLPLEAKHPAQRRQRLSDAQVRQSLIEASIATYPGNCPCPYSTARNGSRCGKRSAYSREGGEAPLCYPKDVSSEMVQDYRDTHPEEQPPT